MRLRGYNSFLPVWYFTLCSVIVLWSTILKISYATTPTLTLSNTNLTVRNGGMLELTCEVDRFTTGDSFRWEHQNSVGNTKYYTTMTTEIPNANVNISFGTTRTVLQFKNLSSVDSGVVKCVYLYMDPPGIGSKAVSLETSLCVSEEPRSPMCYTTEPDKDKFALLCATGGMGLCPLDISLQIRLAGNGTIIDGTRTNSPIEMFTNTIPKEHLADDGYICTLGSNLFPNSNTTCSFDLPETTTLTIFSKKFASDENNKTAITVETNEQTTVGVYVTTNKNEPVTFSKLEVIIAASAAGGGVLLITIFICIIIACCKRCNRLNEKSVEKDASESQSQTSDKKHQNSDILLLERTHQTGQIHEGRKDSMPPYAKPDKSRMKNIAPAYDIVHENNPSYYIINDETSNSALYASADEVDDQQQGQYASVPQTYEEAGPDSDREKVLTPNLSPHEYAYASFDLTSDAPIPEDAANRPAGEGFVDNSIYEPSLG